MKYYELNHIKWMHIWSVLLIKFIIFFKNFIVFRWICQFSWDISGVVRWFRCNIGNSKNSWNQPFGIADGSKVIQPLCIFTLFASDFYKNWLILQEKPYSLDRYEFRYHIRIRCAAARRNLQIVKGRYILKQMRQPKLFLDYFWAMHRTARI